MNQWLNNYTPEFYWPEAYWPIGGALPADSIALTGHTVSFSYGQATLSQVSISSGGSGGMLYIAPRFIRPKRKFLHRRSVDVPIRYGRPTLTQNIAVQSSAIRTTGKPGVLRLKIRTKSTSLKMGGGMPEITPARRQKLHLFSHRIKARPGRVELRNLQPEFEEEIAVLLALLK